MSTYAKYVGGRPPSIGSSSNYARYPAAGSPPPPAFSNLDSVLFSGATGQYVDLGDNIQIQSGDQITISAWVYPIEGTVGGILSNLSAQYGMDFAIIGSGGNPLRLEMYGLSGAMVVTTTTSINYGVWNHIVATYDGSGSTSGMTISLNGVAQSLVAAGSGTGTIPYTEPTKIGNDFYEATPNAYIDEVSIWDIALTPTQITALYNNGLPGDLTGLADLTHWYRMGDAPDTYTTIFDRVGTANGTVVNSAVVAGFTPYFIPTIVSTTQVKNNPNQVVLKGHTGFISYYQAGNVTPGFEAPYLESYNLSNVMTPALVGTLPYAGPLPFPQTPYPLAFAPGNTKYLYIGYYKSPIFLQVLDVSNPANPTVVGQVDNGITSLQSNSIAFSTNGHYAYVSGAANLVAVVDISTPTAPSLVTTFAPGTGTGGDAFSSAAVKGNFLYIAGDVSNTLSVYDISTPTAPSLITTISTQGGYQMLLSPDQNTIYITCFVSGYLQTVDVSTPAAPVVAGQVRISTQTNWSSVYGNNLIMSTADTLSAGGPNLSLSSVWNPASPFILWSVNNQIDGNDVVGLSVNASGKYAYTTFLYETGLGVGDFLGYLQIWQIAP